MASRKPAVIHPCHSHPLRSHKVQVGEEIICSGCTLGLTGPAYICTKSNCDYVLHKSCMSLPYEARHKGHPDHPLTLLYSSSYKKSIYWCNGCGEIGSGFVYNCSTCKYDLHVGCRLMPASVVREGHPHSLTLVYSYPYPLGMFKCDVCNETIPKDKWSYCCKECDYNEHIHSCTVEKNEGGEQKPSG